MYIYIKYIYTYIHIYIQQLEDLEFALLQGLRAEAHHRQCVRLSRAHPDEVRVFFLFLFLFLIPFFPLFFQACNTPQAVRSPIARPPR